jgi:hypothetical protein
MSVYRGSPEVTGARPNADLARRQSFGKLPLEYVLVFGVGRREQQGSEHPT